MPKSNLYTRTGDTGTTSLVGGTRVKKNCARLNAYGTIDEFSAHLGVVLSSPDCPTEIRDYLHEMQCMLFNLGGYLACESPNLSTLPAIVSSASAEAVSATSPSSKADADFSSPSAEAGTDSTPPSFEVVSGSSSEADADSTQPSSEAGTDTSSEVAHTTDDWQERYSVKSWGLTEEILKELERMIDRLDEATPKVNAFVLPGGTPLSAQTHVARTVCRRAERGILQLADESYVDPLAIRYVNRLSDYLFILARYFNHVAGIKELTWHKS